MGGRSYAGLRHNACTYCLSIMGASLFLLLSSMTRLQRIYVAGCTEDRPCLRHSVYSGQGCSLFPRTLYNTWGHDVCTADASWKCQVPTRRLQTSITSSTTYVSARPERAHDRDTPGKFQELPWIKIKCKDGEASFWRAGGFRFFYIQLNRNLRKHNIFNPLCLIFSWWGKRQIRLGFQCCLQEPVTLVVLILIKVPFAVCSHYILYVSLNLVTRTFLLKAMIAIIEAMPSNPVPSSPKGC